MEEEVPEAFKRQRLQSLEIGHLINIIRNENNYQYFANVPDADLRAATKNGLIDLILSVPNVFIDRNMLSDYRHEAGKAQFDELYAMAAANPIYDPGKWVPKINQMEHIGRLTAGLLHPTNEARSALDASKMGRGKTPSAILTAIGLKVRFIMVICPDNVVLKWHAALRPLGLFNYRISTYSGITGSNTATGFRHGRYKPNPVDTTEIQDNDWLSITDTGLTGIHDARYDWTNLPDKEPGYELGGCLVIWDEVQNVKNTTTSKQAVCFGHFIRDLQAEKRKYLRALFLSGTIMEAPKDLPYMLNALGYITMGTKGLQNAFVREQLGGDNFRILMGDSWRPGYELIQDDDKKLLLFLRNVAGKVFKFSQIPDPLPYLLYRIGFIEGPSNERMNSYIHDYIVPNFRRLMGDAWREEMEDPERPMASRLIDYLRHIADDPRLAEFSIIKTLDAMFKNQVEFQGLTLDDSDVDQFIKINREIGAMLLEIRRNNNRFDSGMLGQIQKMLTELEALKLPALKRLATKALAEPLPNGAKSSVVFAMTRTSSVRYFAWRFEAMMFLEAFHSGNPSDERVREVLGAFIRAILNAQADYKTREAAIIEANKRRGVGAKQALQLKSTFTIHSIEQLVHMSEEDITAEYIRWTTYLDITKFEYVAILVSDFGDPKPTKFDMESPDKADHVKESGGSGKKYKDVMTKMKKEFQENRRRVFVTNINSAKEGIDMHDTSDGGMHPRTAIICPPLSARVLLQMLGRFEREGQTSDSVKFVTFIGDIRGVTSWEAKFMDKLSLKVKDIQLLHDGEISLDITDNIEKDGGSIISAVLNDLRRESAQFEDSMPDITQFEEVVEERAPARVREVGGLMPAAQHNVVSGFFQKALGARRSPNKPVIVGGQAVVGQDVIMPGKFTLNLNETHFFFDVSRTAHPDAAINLMIGVLVEFDVNPRYYTRVQGGVILFRPGLRVAGISQTQVIARIEAVLELTADQMKVAEGYFSAVFNPQLIVDNLVIDFESPTSMLVTPSYPTELLFPMRQLMGETLRSEAASRSITRFIGTTPKIIVAFYALKMIALFQAPNIYTKFSFVNLKRFSEGIDRSYLFTTTITNGRYIVSAHRDVLQFLSVILSCYRVLEAPLLANEVLEDYSEDAGGYATVSVKPAYQAMITKLIGREPVNK